jgi:hypothetical protein
MAFHLAGGKPRPVAKARPDGGADGLEDGILAFAAARGSVEGT